MRVDSVGMTLDDSDKVRTWVSRSENRACLVITGSRTQHEIRMSRVHVETLLTQLPDVLAGMTQTADQDAACRNAELSSERASNAVDEAFGLASQADAAGAPEIGNSIREAANRAITATIAVEVAVRKFEEAAATADSATDRLFYVLREADAAVQQPTDTAMRVVAAIDQANDVDLAAQPDETAQSAGDTAVQGYAVPIDTSGAASSSAQEPAVHSEPVPMVVAARRLLGRGTWTSSPVPAAPTFTRTWPDGSVDTLLLVGPGGVAYGRRDDPGAGMVWQLDGPLREVAPALNVLAAPGTPGAPNASLDDPRSEIK
jgi:hypothetical protein